MIRPNSFFRLLASCVPPSVGRLASVIIAGSAGRAALSFHNDNQSSAAHPFLNRSSNVGCRSFVLNVSCSTRLLSVVKGKEGACATTHKSATSSKSTAILQAKAPLPMYVMRPWPPGPWKACSTQCFVIADLRSLLSRTRHRPRRLLSVLSGRISCRFQPA